MNDQAPAPQLPPISPGTRLRRATRQLIRAYEARALKKRPFAIRVADYLTTYFGSVEFLFLNILSYISWIVINTGVIPGIEPFDPFPFILLTMTVSLEAIILSVIILMSQNRQSYIGAVRDELDLQVNLLSEREVTKALRLLVALHKHHKIQKGEDPELDSMLRATNISYIQHKLEEQLHTDQPTFPQIVTKPITKFTQAVKTLSPKNGKGGGKQKSS